MKVAVLPFNAAEGTRPALGRQFANFACDTLRVATGTEDINTVSFLTQIEDDDGPRAAFVNVADTLLAPEWIQQMFDQSDVAAIMDGMLSQKNGSFELTLRFHKRDEEKPILDETIPFPQDKVFGVLHRLVKELAKVAELELPEPLAGEKMDFGTESGDAFLKFLEGYDSLMYVQQTNGRVAKEFSPEPAIDALLAATKADPDFLGPYESLVQLCRLCAQHRLGEFEKLESALNALVEQAEDDFRAFFALGELYQSIGDAAKASDAYEKAVRVEPNEPALHTRLGMAQLAMGMPVNAERNFRRALELEGDDKPSLDYLALVLGNTGREHEIPALWKEQIERTPDNAHAHAKHALSLVQSGREQEGVEAFESALKSLSDPAVVKRYYAPMLAEKGDVDRAMDFYEDCLDVSPTDIQLLLEYAQTLEKAGREFEVPKVLRDALACNPDPNTKATILARLIELEQPRRAEAVEQAKQKLEENMHEEALGLLKPLKNWLADYWKLWILLAAAHNAREEFAEAEDAARRLSDLFPAYEPAYIELNRALHGQGRDEEAYNLLRFLASRMPQSATIHVNLALAAYRSGKTEEAVQLKQRLREAAGANEELEKVLAEIKD